MKGQLDMMSGHANKKLAQYKQIGTVATSILFYAFMPVGANATLTTLTELGGGNAKTQNADGVYYQNVVYFGSFQAITPATGDVLLYLSDQ